MQQRLVEKEKAAKEENLRMLAQRAREERGGITTAASRPAPTGLGGAGLGGYGSDASDSDASDDEETSRRRDTGKGRAVEGGSDEEGGDGSDDEEARKVRDEMRAEKRREREREMRMNNMGTEQRAKMLARSVPSFHSYDLGISDLLILVFRFSVR